MTLLSKPLLIRNLLIAIALVVTAGCRNTTSTPGAPLGTSTPMSPLSPVQGSASLAPLQPSSGIGSLGAPTRVPPPPTGSYSAPNNYGGNSTLGAPPANYAPGGLAPSGATLGSTGMTRGVTNLGSSLPAPVSSGIGGVQQTGWVGDATPAPAAAAAPLQAPPPIAPVARPATGGMQVIDLTQAPFPPGYVPPQARPGAAPLPQTVPYPQSSSGIAPSPGQPVNTTFVRASPVVPGNTGFNSGQTIQTAGRPENTLLPSTEPFSTSASTDNELQWRRPSPRF